MGKATERCFKAALVLLLLIIAAGCEKKEKDAEEVITGTDGLVISFVENFPQDKYILSPGETQDFTAVVEVKNKGATPLDSGLEHLLHESFKQYLILNKYAKEPTYIDVRLKDYWNNLKEDDKKANGGTFENYVANYHKYKDPDVDHKAEFAKFKNSTGRLFIGGFDGGIIVMNDKNDDKTVDFDDKSEPLLNMLLSAKSQFNPNGGFGTVEFGGKIAADKLGVNRYEPVILATACYPYATKAGPNVCIDPIPFDDKQKKVCSIGSHTLSSQGAPIAVTRIDQEASSTKLRFKITIENAGNGDVIQPTSLQKCSSATNQLKREDFDLVELTSVKAGTKELLADCGPFAKQGTNLIRLFDGEGFVVCTMDITKLGSSAYLTPLIVELKYGYRTTASKPISIRKIE